MRTQASEYDLVQLYVQLRSAYNIAPAAKATEYQCPCLYNADHHHIIEPEAIKGIRFTFDD